MIFIIFYNIFKFKHNHSNYTLTIGVLAIISSLEFPFNVNVITKSQ